MTSVERVDAPPHDVEAEESLVGAMLLSSGAIDAAHEAGVTPQDFYVPDHRKIAAAVNELHAAGVPVDVITVASELGDQLGECGARRELRRLQAQTPASANAPAYARVVRDRARRREAMALGQDLVKVASEGGDIGAVADRLSAAAAPVDVGSRFVSGGSFILDAPEHPPVLCGTDDAIMWARGESLILAGPPGVGKTTLEIQLVGAGIGVLDSVLGMPVEPSSRTLVLACDRPEQFARAARRLFNDVDRALLDDRLVVWKGPPPRDFGRHPDALLAMAREARADRVFIDSLKDVALGISDDEVGAGLNSALQLALAEGVDVCCLHHLRKGQGGGAPKTLGDVYGSTWIAAGAGSVVLLWGAAGDPVVGFVHLKQPAAALGPWKIEHDHVSGLSTISAGPRDPLRLLQSAPRGLTSRDLAAALSGHDAPTDSDRRNAQRQLERLVERKLAHRTEPTVGGAGGTSPARYFAIAPEPE